MTVQSANGDGGRALIGVDVGGTHTDVCVSAGGQLVRGKALTTHDDYSVGVVEAIGVAAGELDRTTAALLADTEALVSGTTVVTNALTELRGAKVGVLITRGFKDVFRFAGGARRPLYDDQQQDNPPDVVERSCIKEIDERAMSDGSELVPLDEGQVRAAIRDLREQGVETIAICFLWSFLEPAHERRAAEIVREEWPEAFVTLSSDVFPVVREHERFYSAVFNSYCQPSVVRLLDTLAERLRGEGFAGHLSFFAGAGGAITRELAGRFPLLLLASGPAGGVTGAITLAERMGTRDVLVGDMGGTSFDTTLIRDLQPIVRPRAEISNMPAGLATLDILSIGAGGGSLAGVDSRGVPKVGPQSAGSMPGPVCYGRGGTVATVTDAAVVAGYIDPENYLNGRLALDRQGAAGAIDRFGANFGWDGDQSVNAILELTATNMADALRAVTIERGQDPRECTMFAYGGTLPMFAAAICSKLDIDRVVIPRNSSVFSAYGVMVAKFLRRYSRSLQMTLVDPAVAGEVGAHPRRDVAPGRRGGAGGRDRGGGALVQLGRGSSLHGPDLRDRGAARRRGADHRGCARAGGGLPGALRGVLRQGHGLGGIAGDAREREPDRDRASGPCRHCGRSRSTAPASSGPRRSGARSWCPAANAPRCRCTTARRWRAGASVSGPAIVDEHDTTLVVPAGWTCRRDEYLNYIMERDSG